MTLAQLQYFNGTDRQQCGGNSPCKSGGRRTVRYVPSGDPHSGQLCGWNPESRGVFLQDAAKQCENILKFNKL